MDNKHTKCDRSVRRFIGDDRTILVDRMDQTVLAYRVRTYYILIDFVEVIAIYEKVSTYRIHSQGITTQEPLTL